MNDARPKAVGASARPKSATFLKKDIQTATERSHPTAAPPSPPSVLKGHDPRTMGKVHPAAEEPRHADQRFNHGVADNSDETAVMMGLLRDTKAQEEPEATEPRSSALTGKPLPPSILLGHRNSKAQQHRASSPAASFRANSTLMMNMSSSSHHQHPKTSIGVVHPTPSADGDHHHYNAKMSEAILREKLNMPSFTGKVLKTTTTEEGTPYSSPARQLHRELAEQRQTQFDMASELAEAKEAAEFYRQRCARLEDELVLAYTEFVPPATFLPKTLQDRHREVIDAINDYALLYRSTKLQLLYDRCGKHQDPTSGEWRTTSNENSEKERLRRAMEKQEEQQENKYLRDRVNALTTQVEALQEQLAGSMSFVSPSSKGVRYGR